MVWVDRRKTRSVSLTPSILSAYNGLFAVSVIMPVRKLDGVGRACVPKGRRRIRTAVRNTVRAVVSEDPSLMMATAFGLACCLVFWGAGSSLETVAMRSSELASLGAQADALPTFVSTGGTLAALVLVGCIPKRFAGRLCGSGLYAIACAALAVVYALTLAPLSVSVFAVRMGLLVARGFLGASTLFLWFVLIGRCKRSFHVVVLALAFACAALLDLAFLALQPIVGIAALVSLPALSVAMHRIVARRLGLCAHPVEDEVRFRSRSQGEASVCRRLCVGIALGASCRIAVCVLPAIGGGDGLHPSSWADPVLDHDRLAKAMSPTTCWSPALSGLRGALVVAGAAFARGEGDEPLLSYQRLVVIIALVLSLCLVNVTLQAGTFVSLTAAKFIGALLLSYSWLAALSTRKAGGRSVVCVDARFVADRCGGVAGHCYGVGWARSCAGGERGRGRFAGRVVDSAAISVAPVDARGLRRERRRGRFVGDRASDRAFG